MDASLVFAFDDYANMANSFNSGLDLMAGTFQVKQFPNKEQHITLDANVSGRQCYVLGSLAPPESRFFSFLLLCHTLKKEGASRVIAILPYFAYSRHDKNEAQKSYTTAFIAELMACAGITDVITFDMHSPIGSQLFTIPLISLSPVSVFGGKLKEMDLKNTILVAPDEGAIKRCEAIANAAGIGGNILYMIKKRMSEGIFHTEQHGVVKEHAVIIDDMLDTGGTLISCCRSLLEAGVKSIDIMITHGLFTGETWRQLWELGVRDIYCTDTIPLAEERRHPHIHVLPVGHCLKAVVEPAKVFRVC